jgi:hypothetical protein
MWGCFLMGFLSLPVLVLVASLYIIAVRDTHIRLEKLLDKTTKNKDE